MFIERFLVAHQRVRRMAMFIPFIVLGVVMWSLANGPGRQFTRAQTNRGTRLAALHLAPKPAGNSLVRPGPAVRARLSGTHGRLRFEANRGQTDPKVKFLSRGSGYSLFLTPTKAVLSLKQGDTSNVVSMRVVGANPVSHVAGLDKQPSSGPCPEGRPPVSEPARQSKPSDLSLGERRVRATYPGGDDSSPHSTR